MPPPPPSALAPDLMAHDPKPPHEPGMAERLGGSHPSPVNGASPYLEAVGLLRRLAAHAVEVPSKLRSMVVYPSHDPPTSGGEIRGEQ
jgi:hypothetical protein